MRADGSGLVRVDGFTDEDMTQEAEELKSDRAPVLPSKEEEEQRFSFAVQKLVLCVCS